MARVRRTREEWEQLISEFKASQLSQRRFAEEHSLSISTFRTWLYKIRKHVPAEQKPLPAPGTDKSHPANPKSLSHVPDLVAERAARRVDELRTQRFIKGLSDLESRLDDIEERLRSLGNISSYVKELAESTLEEVVADRLATTVEEILPEFTSAFLENVQETLAEDYDFLDEDTVDEHQDDYHIPHESLDDILERLESVELKLSQDNATHSTIIQITDRILGARRKGRALTQERLKFNLSPAELVSELRKRHFYVSQALAEQILLGLEEKKLLVLEGVPGTGKTRLAQLLADILLPDGFGPKSTLVNVFPEATTAHSIGGLRQIGERFAPSFGWLTKAVLDCIESRGNHWLILDEINRGDVSNLLGPVLDALEPNKIGAIDHPHLFPEHDPESGSIPIPGTFRIIGTRNPFDSEVLFNFTHALERRSRAVSIPPLIGAAELDFVENAVIAKRMKEMGWHSEKSAEFKALFQLDSTIAELCAVVNHVRSLAEREPRYLFQTCEVGTAIMLSLAERLCRALTASGAVEIEAARSTLDACLADVLFERPDRFGRQALSVILREVLDSDKVISRRKLESAGV